MRENHMIGITPVITPDYQLLKDARIQWMRMHVPLPYTDRLGGALSERLTKALGNFRAVREKGFQIIGSTPGPGSSRYDPQTRTTRWLDAMPAWAGKHDSVEYYKVLEELCAEMARQAAGVIDWWQIANEPDIDIFRGPLSDGQIIDFLLCSARGIKKGNPAAKTGINLGFITDYSRKMVYETYGFPGSPWDYLGLDGYFGSWQPGGPQDWPPYIDEMWKIARKPLIINEWGYSSLQRGDITDDPQRQKRYNQGVCKAKAWDRVWKKEHSPQEQAEYVTECMKIFADHPRVIGNMFFRYNDAETCWQCGQRDCPAECAWGMVDVQGKPKPAYYALKDAVHALFT